MQYYDCDSDKLSVTVTCDWATCGPFSSTAWGDIIWVFSAVSKNPTIDLSHFSSFSMPPRTPTYPRFISESSDTVTNPTPFCSCVCSGIISGCVLVLCCGAVLCCVARRSARTRPDRVEGREVGASPRNMSERADMNVSRRIRPTLEASGAAAPTGTAAPILYQRSAAGSGEYWRVCHNKNNTDSGI